MRIGATKQECRRLIDLVHKEREKAAEENEATPHALLELRGDDMRTLENNLENAIQRQSDRERRSAR